MWLLTQDSEELQPNSPDKRLVWNFQVGFDRLRSFSLTIIIRGIRVVGKNEKLESFKLESPK